MLVALVGVMDTVSPVVAKVEDELVAVVSKFAVFTCAILLVGLAAAKVKLALSDAAVKTSPLVYVVNGMVPTLR